MREALVKHDIPQKNWPTTEIVITSLARPEVSAVVSNVARKVEDSVLLTTWVLNYGRASAGNVFLNALLQARLTDRPLARRDARYL